MIHLYDDSRDTTLKLWDAANGNLTISMGGHTGPVTSLTMIPADDPRFVLDSDQEDTVGRGRKVISGSTDCSLRIWALDTGNIVDRLSFTNNCKILFLNQLCDKLMINIICRINANQIIHLLACSMYQLSGWNCGYRLRLVLLSIIS